MGVNNILQLSRILLHEKPIILFLHKYILISVCLIKNVVGLASLHRSKVKIITKADSSFRKTDFHKLQLFQSFQLWKSLSQKTTPPNNRSLQKKPPQITPGWLRWFGFQKGTYFLLAPKRTLKAAPTTPGF